MWKSTLNRSGILSKYCSSTSIFKMKSLIVLLLFSVSITLFADTWGDYRYTDNGSDITITGYTGSGGDITIPSEINGKPVVEIGDYAFEERTSLKSVTIPNSVTTIADSAFSRCTSLGSVKIGNSVTTIGDRAFSNCTSLTSITIGDSVTNIGNRVFSNCTSLTSVKIGYSVTSIGDGTFRDCTKLTSITIDAVNPNYSSFNGVLFNKDQTTLIQYPIGKSETSYTIPDSVTSIKNSAFRDCTSLTSITIPDSVTSIGFLAFSGCSSLGSVTIPDSVTSIGDSAFSRCTSLPSVTIPDSITSIGNDAFHGCTSLTSVTIPNSVTSIGDNAFAYCESLTSVTIPDSVTSIGDNAFAYCENLTSITIGDSVISIGSYAFYSCTSLSSVTIPDSVTSIGGRAFLCCSSIASVTIGNSVTSIGDSAFDRCTSLTFVTIPDSITSIGNDAFNSCSSLTSVTIGNGVTSIGDSAFCDCIKLTSITVDATNSNYSSLAGVLFNKDQMTLIQYPIGKSETSYTVPTSVTSIENNAFSYCSSLTSVTIPNSVTNIGDYAFYYCYSLTSITIPNSVTSVGWSVFYCCESLTTAIFSGNAPTTFGKYVFKACDSRFTVYYYAGATGFSSPTWQGYPCEELPVCHSADTDSNWSISQSEVNSFIANYANNNNTVSTISGDITPGRITMREVLRVIYLSGAYQMSDGTIDGYDIVRAEESIGALPPTTISSETNHTLVCANSADSGAGSFRNLIANSANGDTITFDESLKKITLASEIVIDKSITIDGNGITIVSGSGKMRIFQIYNENEDLFVTLLNMGIVDANNSADEFGGAIYNNGENLTLENCLLNNNANIVEDGKGGAIYSSGTLTINNCEFTGNFASEESDVYSTDD